MMISSDMGMSLMSDNIITFTAKSKMAEHILTLTVHQLESKEYEVSMEVADKDPHDIFDAMLAASFKYAEDNELLDMGDEDA